MPAPLRWRELSPGTQEALSRKLEGLYGQGSDEAAFDALALDKQQALLIIARRFLELNLWDAVRHVENVYGLGGVGMNFAAWPVLRSRLEASRNFTTRWANHPGTTGGFLQRFVSRASLHLLYVDEERKRRWAAHFDFYNPWASPLNAGRHLLHEKIRGLTPDWQSVSRTFWPGESILKSV